MRKKDKIILWPVYFDSTKTRLEGRRIPKNLATSKPKLNEIQMAVKQTGLQPEVVLDAGRPSVPWQKTGLIVVPKSGSKTQTLRMIAKELLKVREKR
jgi:signal recognition particle subunit SRP19